MPDNIDAVCQLCKRNKANKTNSHIVPAFWLKSQIGERGKEKAYIIAEEPTQDYTENVGAEGLAEDFILCSDCETRLGYVENYFSTEVIQKIEDANFAANFEKRASIHGDLLKCKRVNPIAFHLLIYSIIWRAAISNQPVYGHFTLPEKVLEDLRFTLDLFLPNTVNHKIEIKQDKWLKTIENCQSLFSFFPYIIVKADSLPDKTGTFTWLDNVSTSPNHIILNEYIILPFFQTMEWKNEDNFFELRNDLNLMDLLNNHYEEVNVGIISNDRYNDIISKLQAGAATKRQIKDWAQKMANGEMPIPKEVVDKIDELLNHQ